MTLRILHVLDHSVPLHSGYTFRTLALLREQRNLGWETIHLTSPKQGHSALLEERSHGLTFYRTPSVDGVSLVNQMRLTANRLDEIIQINRPDVIHAHSPVLNAIPSLWVGRRRHLPVVYEMRASWEDAAVDHGTTSDGSIRYKLSRALETFALFQAQQVTTICEGLRTDIIARGVPQDRITVIPNAVDANLFRFGVKPNVKLRDSLHLEGAIVIGFAGSFYGYEGLGLLLAAAQRMVPRYPHLRLLLVGGGPHEAALRAQASSSGLEGHVIFTGRVPHADVQRYYELMDILAYPRIASRLTDKVTPLKPLEAMAQGRILVASDVGGHRELVRHGETGFLFRSGDVSALEAALDGVLSQPENWPRIRLQARRFVELERTWTNSVARYSEVYRKALMGHESNQPLRV
jgi:glycogen(starch) synthase